MVSRRRVPSPTSSSSSCYESWQDGDILSVDREHDRVVERLSDDDEREVARRVLEDLERIYFDESDDEESEDEDEFKSSSEWGSDVSSHSSRGRRNAGGMTLEELTVVVNAAIEYHRPTQHKVVESPVKLSKRKTNEKLRQHLDEPSPHHRRRNQRQYPFTRSSSQTGELVLEMFQDMLERKEKHFYALRATKIAADDEVRGNQNGETATSRTITVNQHQQTTSSLRDQPTETEDFPHRPALNESLQVAEFDTSLHSPSSEVSPYELMEPIAGPTLADLAPSHRKTERYPSSFQSYPASEASRSSSSFSSATDPAILRSQSSFVSGCSSASSTSSHSKSSTKSDTSSRHSSHTSKKSNRSNGTNSRASPPGRSSKHNSHRHVSPESSIETTPPNNCEFTLSKKDQVEEASQVAVSPLTSDPPQVLSRPDLVTWELDLSNFAF